MLRNLRIVILRCKSYNVNVLWSTKATIYRTIPFMPVLEGNYEGRSQPAFLTLEIAPSAFPPGKTLIIPPGTNTVQVALECSTNLVQWIPATNGVYGGD